jgi:autotransporter-associated beta strand protein
MSPIFRRIRFLVAAALLFSVAQRFCLAGSATWSSNPSSGDWNTAANWTPQTVPNSTTDIATFNASNLTNLSVGFGSIINLDSAVFNSGAPAYTITLDVSNLILDGAGFVNNSGSMQSVVIPEADHLVGAMFFYNSATAGNMTSFSTVGGLITFYGSSSGGAATFDLTDGFLQADMDFNDDSTAGNATINAGAGAVIEFLDSSSGGNATLNLTSEAFVLFEGSNNAEHMTGNCIGGNQDFGSAIEFQGFSSAGEGTFTTIGGSTSGEKGGFIEFDNHATAGNATFVIGGGLGAGLAATTLTFYYVTTAAAANISANGGADGSDGGAIIFTERSKGGTASITLSRDGELDISTHAAPGVTIGSLAGVGSIFLGTNTLTIGSNNQSTTFSGVIQDTGGLTKTGAGTLTLTGRNTYTGTTTVTAGVLGISNKRGSGTGMGSVNVQAGTLGGKGIISGAVAIGTGSGDGAFLAPAAGTNVQAMLTIQSTLTFNADATYACTFKANRNRTRTDEVIANGVTINSDAMIALSGQTQGRLTTGVTLTLISNTSANPISGTFANLPDGGIVTINRNNFQASYSGGDGNDLTLTVVP